MLVKHGETPMFAGCNLMLLAEKSMVIPRCWILPTTHPAGVADQATSSI